MRKKAILNVFVGFIFLLLSSSSVQSAGWEEIGQRNIKRIKKVADFIVKTETPYQVIKLNIGNIGIYVHSVSVFFADGEEIVTEINSAISPYADTPPIYIPENRPPIHKVRLKYKAKKRSIITIWATTDTSQARTPTVPIKEED
jgi:hypothetical protein